MNINEKVIVITGGGKGLGRAAAEHIASKGGHLALLDVDQTILDTTVSQLQAMGAKAKAYLCNVTDEATVEATFKAINADFGAIHGLVNNAGVLRDAALVKAKEGKVIKKMSINDFELVVDVHMKGAFLCSREAATYMIENQVDDACIVNMSSTSFRGNFGQTNYSAAKAGLVAMTRVWSKELARYNIRSVAIAPGTIATDMLASMPEAALEQLETMIPLGRVGQAKHIAQAIVSAFENDYMSGGVVDVNGGLFM